MHAYASLEKMRDVDRILGLLNGRVEYIKEELKGV